MSIVAHNRCTVSWEQNTISVILFWFVLHLYTGPAHQPVEEVPHHVVCPFNPNNSTFLHPPHTQRHKVHTYIVYVCMCVCVHVYACVCVHACVCMHACRTPSRRHRGIVCRYTYFTLLIGMQYTAGITVSDCMGVLFVQILLYSGWPDVPAALQHW